MNAEEKSRYFQELTHNLRYAGLAVKPETMDGLLPVELDGQRLCHITETGGVRYREENIADDARRIALDRVTGIARTTAEYMSRMETAPQLTASGLTGDYRLLAEFNNVVLAGHPTQHGVQFADWERAWERTGLYAGNYFGPSGGVDCYASAKQDFAARSGLVSRGALFTPEQLAEIYHCSAETLAGAYPIPDERQKCLRSIIEQIEHIVPDLGERLQQGTEFDSPDAPRGGGMQFC